MGMFDNIKVKSPLPLNEDLSKLNIAWEEEVFQTKDLDNLLDLYEITQEGKLIHLVQEREWVPNEDSIIKGSLEVKSEKWEEVPFHGVVRFYTSYCDVQALDADLIDLGGKNPSRQKTWQEIFATQGNDWWIEFLAIFDSGLLREIRIGNVEKTPISARLASNKEWELRREMKEKQLINRVVKKLRKIPGYSKATRLISRTEQKCHEKLSNLIRKLS
jgi:hypothetical protein